MCRTPGRIQHDVHVIADGVANGEYRRHFAGNGRADPAVYFKCGIAVLFLTMQSELAIVFRRA